ncbi:molybdopterin-dependent oxidoreductase [Collimonas sp.]|jgi:sulfite dehydrogenase|uniref:SorA family sulfite dehydrogenase catalytic subunit n=1 Tax=Collimonas sp. TaxID=1963772 RepID=UPI002C485A75|nr:molybdopterin-dependent oxidoreductase [Collimonas sp.]HWW07040.1 molybdopterin-dependent oxidoreductase [Collimonas sp.]
MKFDQGKGASSRRKFLQHAGFAAGALALAPLRSVAAAAVTTASIPVENGERDLIAYPQKRPLLRITTRPPHLETPFSVFNEGPLTANDAFFVRYHLANIPTSIDADTYRLRISGRVERELSLSLAELKAIAPAVEVVAVNQCSGNSRAFSKPRVFGAQLGNGSMGNARWVGVPLKAVLEHAGVMAEARQVSFKGLDQPVLPTTPEFIKALDIDHALSAEPIIAWSMNGTDIPFLNGYPIKLIVPGYFGTYWVKHLNQIEVLDHVYDGFFMATAYRVPDNDCQCVPAATAPGKTRPISRLKTRSFITSLHDGSIVHAGRRTELKGIAFDGGSGIKAVDISEDGGQTWKEAVLGKDLGKYSFREWRFGFTPARKGELQLMVRATAQSGEIQPLEATWNPAGYARNVIETTKISVA